MQDAPRILKFGGSSLGQVGPLGQVLDIVARERELGRIAVVVSALGDTTDWLLDAAQAAASGAPEAAEEVVDRIDDLATAAVGAALAARGKTWHALDEVVATELLPLRILLQGIAAVGECSPRVRDRVLAFGESLAASVVAGALRAVGVAAERVDARTWLVTDDQHGNASVDLEATRARVDALGGAWFAGETAERTVTVHTGFIGATSEEVTTTLGRNGSDYTAALLAAVTKARELAIWTDVSGIMTADPGLVAEAYPVEALSYREVLELAGLGPDVHRHARRHGDHRRRGDAAIGRSAHRPARAARARGRLHPRALRGACCARQRDRVRRPPGRRAPRCLGGGRGARARA